MIDRTTAKLDSWLSKADAALADDTNSARGPMVLSDLGACGRWIIYWSNKMRQQDFAKYETIRQRVAETISKSAKRINEFYRKSTTDSMSRHKPGTKSYSEGLFSPIYYLHNHSMRLMTYSGDVEEKRNILSYFVTDVAPAFSNTMDYDRKQLVSDLLEEAKRIGITVPEEIQEKFTLPSEEEIEAKDDCGLLLDLAATALERSRRDPVRLVRVMSGITALVLSSEALEIHLQFLYNQYSKQRLSTQGRNRGMRLSIPEYTGHLRKAEDFTPTQLTQFDRSYEMMVSLIRRGEEPRLVEVAKFFKAVYAYLRPWLGWGYAEKMT